MHLGVRLDVDIKSMVCIMVCMKRTNIHLTDRQREELKKQSIESGLTVAELIRRAVDRFLRSVRREATK